MSKNKRKKRFKSYDKALKYLSQIEYINIMIREKQDIIDSLQSSIMIMSVNMKNERVKTSPKDRISETCTKIIDLREQMNKDIKSLIDTEAEIIETIDTYVDNLKQRRVLYLRYLKFLSISSIAKEMHISERTAYRFHNDAVHKVSQKFTSGREWQKMADNGKDCH